MHEPDGEQHHDHQGGYADIHGPLEDATHAIQGVDHQVDHGDSGLAQRFAGPIGVFEKGGHDLEGHVGQAQEGSQPGQGALRLGVQGHDDLGGLRSPEQLVKLSEPLEIVGDLDGGPELGRQLKRVAGTVIGGSAGGAGKGGLGVGPLGDVQAKLAHSDHPHLGTVADEHEQLGSRPAAAGDKDPA